MIDIILKVYYSNNNR